MFEGNDWSENQLIVFLVIYVIVHISCVVGAAYWFCRRYGKWIIESHNANKRPARGYKPRDTMDVLFPKDRR